MYGARSCEPRRSRAPARKKSRPVSRVLSRTVIPLGSPSPWTSSGLPGSARGSALHLPWEQMRLPYLALLRVGFAVPSRVTTDAVRSYRTVSPLPVPRGTWADCSLLHFPWARAPQALPGTRSAGARTFLHRSEASAATARPTLADHDTGAAGEVKCHLYLYAAAPRAQS